MNLFHWLYCWHGLVHFAFGQCILACLPLLSGDLIIYLSKLNPSSEYDSSNALNFQLVYRSLAVLQKLILPTLHSLPWAHLSLFIELRLLLRFFHLIIYFLARAFWSFFGELLLRWIVRLPVCGIGLLDLFGDRLLHLGHSEALSWFHLIILFVICILLFFVRDFWYLRLF